MVKQRDFFLNEWIQQEAPSNRVTMWTSSMAHQHKFLTLWTTGLHQTALIPRPGSLSAFHHVSAALQSPKDGNPGMKKRRREPDVGDWRQKPERSVQSKPWKRDRDTPVLQKPNQRRWDDSRMSQELRRLSLEDFPEEKDVLLGQRSTPDSTAYDDDDVVFGVAPCLMALTQGRRTARKLFVKDGESSNRGSVLAVCEEAHRRGVQVQRVSKRDLDKMSNAKVHQGVCLQASPLAYLTENQDSAPSRRTPPLWLVLERVQDPMNLGGILRSAYFLGVDRVASSVRHSCPLSPVVSKASAGVMEVMGVYGYENLEVMLKSKVAQGWEVVGTVGAAAEESQVPITQCWDFQMSKPTLLLMGGEGDGLSRQLLSLCQTLLTVPAGRELLPGIESLNVSVATGILLHSLLSSRRSAEDAGRRRTRRV